MTEPLESFPAQHNVPVAIADAPASIAKRLVDETPQDMRRMLLQLVDGRLAAKYLSRVDPRITPENLELVRHHVHELIAQEA